MVISTSDSIIRLCVALHLGAIIGYERQAQNKAAGLRTHTLVCVGSCLCMIISINIAMDHFLLYGYRNADPERIAAQVISGVGFLGAGTILANQKARNVRGLTTAAGLWAVAAIGLVVGAGYLAVAVAATVLIFVVLTVFIRLDKRLSSQHRREYTVHIIMKNTIGQSRRLAEYLENRQMNVKAFRILSDEDSEQAELAVTLIANDGIESDEIIRRLLTVKGVTLAELEEVLDRAGDLLPFEGWMFAENLLGLTCEFYLSRYVDREAGTCDFESQEFYDYLTWCKTWAGDGTIADTPQESLLHYTIVGNPEYVITRRADGEPRNRTYVGFPVEEGYGHELYVPTQIGIAAGTGHRTGAEAFVRFCVEEYPALTDQDMPATAADLEAIIDRCARGEAVDWDGTALVLDEAAYDQFRQLLENTTVVAETDTTMREIVTDEAAYFFAGERTAEETAALIQQRVSLYLLEQQEAP